MDKPWGTTIIFLAHLIKELHMGKYLRRNDKNSI